MFEMLFYPQVEYDIIFMVNVGKKNRVAEPRKTNVSQTRSIKWPRVLSTTDDESARKSNYGERHLWPHRESKPVCGV